jgi:hypothetical protein
MHESAGGTLLKVGDPTTMRARASASAGACGEARLKLDRPGDNPASFRQAKPRT